MKRSKAEAIGNGVFLIVLGFLFYFNWWWPGILVAVWASFAVRQLLTGRQQDFLLTTLLLGCLFLVVLFNLSWNMLTPLLFILGGGYLIYKEYSSDDVSER
jgi:hypothetical protein